MRIRKPGSRMKGLPRGDQRPTVGTDTRARWRWLTDLWSELLTSTSFARRRVIATGAVLVALLFSLAILRVADAHLMRTSIMSGGILMACLVILIAIGLRRRLPILPLGSVSSWTQVHIYTGVFACGVYFMHVPKIIGDGILESTLSLLFLFVSGSGVYGIFASRRLPPRLTVIKGEHRFDQVTWHRNQIAIAARDVISKAVSNDASKSRGVLADYYRDVLEPFFVSGPSVGYLVVPNSRRRHRLLSGLFDRERYLDAWGKQIAGQLAGLVRRRDDLDYQFALQARLRGWVCLHGIASMVLLVVAVIHGVLAWRFGA
ncbi:MAG: hypothetical protein AAGD07_04030 [Planctomycetota bacterium]